MRKNVQVTLLVLSLAALLIVGGTMAWFTASADPVVNKFTAGTVKIVLHDEDGKGEEFEAIENVNPGDCFDKVVYVENTGSKKAYVRVQLVPNWEGMEGVTLTEDQDLYDNVEYEIGSDWVKGEGNWYYYKDILAGVDADEDGEPIITTNLIEKVCFDGKLTGNAYQGKVFKLEVNAEAVQASNGAAADVWEIPQPSGVEGEEWGEYLSQDL